MNNNIQLIRLHTVIATSWDGACIERYPNVAEIVMIGDKMRLTMIGGGVTEVTIERSRLQTIEPSEYLFVEGEP